jgi:GNAT superfamily N-acetyltransferase
MVDLSAVEYRIATDDDVNTLAKMRWDFRLEENPATPVHDQATFVVACAEFLRQGLQNQQWTYWVAVYDGMIVAHIFVQRIAKIPKPNRLSDAFGYVTNVYTRSTFRNQGIGSQLMAQVVQWALAQDLENLLVWPSERSVPYYQRAGFVGSTEAMELSIRPYVL